MSMKRKAPYINRQQAATRYPTHEGYVASIPPASTVIPMRGGSLAWMSVAVALVTPHFFQLVFPAPSAASANPVLAQVRGQLVTDQRETFAGRAGYFQIIRSSHVYPAIPLRKCHLTQEPPPPIPAQGYQRVPYFHRSISPEIPMRAARVDAHAAAPINRSAYFKVPAFQGIVQPANAAIPFRTFPIGGIFTASHIPAVPAYIMCRFSSAEKTPVQPAEVTSGGGPEKRRQWSEVWTRPPLAFRWAAEIELDAVLSSTIVHHAAERPKSKAVQPVFTERDRKELVSSISRELQQEQEKREAARMEQAKLEAERIQNDDDEELYTVALMLLD